MRTSDDKRSEFMQSFIRHKHAENTALEHVEFAVLQGIVDNARRDGHDLDNLSDGYHTFAELYEARALYHAHAVRAWLSDGVQVVKSRRHHDGELCFGGGWFLVHADLPSGQVSQHYPDEHWDLFRCPEVDAPKKWDGHTTADVLNRLRAMAGAKTRQPTLRELLKFLHDAGAPLRRVRCEHVSGSDFISWSCRSESGLAVDITYADTFGARVKVYGPGTLTTTALNPSISDLVTAARLYGWDL